MSAYITRKLLNDATAKTMADVGMAIGAALPIILSHPVRNADEAQEVFDHLAELADRADNNGNSNVALVLLGIAGSIGAAYGIKVPEEFSSH